MSCLGALFTAQSSIRNFDLFSAAVVSQVNTYLQQDGLLNSVLSECQWLLIKMRRPRELICVGAACLSPLIAVPFPWSRMACVQPWLHAYPTS